MPQAQCVSFTSHDTWTVDVSNSPLPPTFFGLCGIHSVVRSVFLVVADSRSSSISHAGTCYHAEARSRILFLDMGMSTEAFSRGPVHRMSLPHLTILPSIRRRSGNEHDGLLRWPSKSRPSSDPPKSSLGRQSRGEIVPMRNDSGALQAWGSDNLVPDKYAAKAMEYSRYGSKVQRTVSLSVKYIGNFK